MHCFTLLCCTHIYTDVQSKQRGNGSSGTDDSTPLEDGTNTATGESFGTRSTTTSPAAEQDADPPGPSEATHKDVEVATAVTPAQNSTGTPITANFTAVARKGDAPDEVNVGGNVAKNLTSYIDGAEEVVRDELLPLAFQL
jgi:hypothetical protein